MGYSNLDQIPLFLFYDTMSADVNYWNLFISPMEPAHLDQCIEITLLHEIAHVLIDNREEHITIHPDGNALDKDYNPVDISTKGVRTTFRKYLATNPTNPPIHLYLQEQWPHNMLELDDIREIQYYSRALN